MKRNDHAKFQNQLTQNGTKSKNLKNLPDAALTFVLVVGVRNVVASFAGALAMRGRSVAVARWQVTAGVMLAFGQRIGLAALHRSVLTTGNDPCSDPITPSGRRKTAVATEAAQAATSEEVLS